MARFRPAGLTEKEQIARGEERFSREAEATERLTALALDPVDVEATRIRALQAELGITRFEDLPAAKPLLAIERTLKASLERIGDETALIHIERHLSGAMGSAGIAAPTGEKTKEFRARRDKLQKKLKVGTVEPPVPKADALPETIARALEVFSDKTVKDRPAPGARLTELAEMEIIVSAGIYDVSALIRALRGDAAYELAKALQKRHGALHVELFRCCQALSEAAERERALRSALTAAGYQARSDILPAPAVLSAILILGSELDQTSQITQYRKLLEAGGLLK
jgi:hypothetical protein